MSISIKSFSDVSFQGIPRLKQLRDEHFSTKAEICVELPRLITKYMKENDDLADSPVLRAGKLMKYIMENKQAIIGDNSLMAGATTSKKKGVLLYPDFMALSIWPELETISKRKVNPYLITRQEIDELNFEIFPFWMDRTVQEVSRRDTGNPLCQRIMERIVFFLATKAYCISHMVPDYSMVVNQGLQEIIHNARDHESGLGNTPEDKKKKDFYQAVQMSLEGVIAYANNLSSRAGYLAEKEKDPVRKKELLKMKDICARVPAEKSETFHEALNAIWICKIAMHQENANAATSFGRLDQILYEFYKKDIERGMTDQEAAELLGCFWLKVPDHLPVSPQTGEELFGGAGSVMSITLGGVDEQGKDAVNELTLLMLRITELLALKDPNVNIRYYPEVNSREYLKRVCEVNVKTSGTPCFHNDTAVIEMLKGMGIPTDHANDYSIVGCVEPVAGGRSFPSSGSIMINLSSVLEMTLFQGKHRLTEDEQIGQITAAPSGIRNFEQFLDAFKTQLIWLIDQAVMLNNNFGRTHREIHATPFLSALTQGTMNSGKDVTDGGAIYNSSGATIIGLAEVVDSITAIEEFVFSKKEITFADMIKAISSNWSEEFSVIHTRMKTSKNKYGRESYMACKNAVWLMDLIYSIFREKENCRGGKYTVGYWSMTNHAGFGLLTGAMPSGRRKGENLPSGITPVSGSAPELTACLNFMSGLEQHKITNGHALNLKYTPDKDMDKMLAKFRDSVHAYMKMGGLQVQFNIINQEKLKEACEFPERYPELLVRVSGYSAYFKDLNKYMKQEIIDRAEYDLNTDRQVNY